MSNQVTMSCYCGDCDKLSHTQNCEDCGLLSEYQTHYNDGDILTLNDGKRYIRANNDWVFLDGTMPIEHEFVDPRYMLGERVRVYRDAPVAEWFDEGIYVRSELRFDEGIYIRSELRMGEAWHLVRPKQKDLEKVGHLWVRDQEITWWGICGQCGKPCREDDYLCPPCRNQ